MQTVFVLDNDEYKTEKKEVMYTDDGVEIPNFQPVEFDGTRLDLKKSHMIIIQFDTKTDRDKAFGELVAEGYNCRKKDEYD